MLSSDISDQKQIEAKETDVDTTAYDAARMARLNEYTASNNMAAMRLEICFAPEVSVNVGDVKYVSESVLHNSSHLLQQKLTQQSLVKPTVNEVERSANMSQNSIPPLEKQSSTASLLDVLNSYDADKPLKITEYS